MYPAIAALGAASLLVCVASLVALHLLPTGFVPLRDPISNYAVSNYGYLYNIQAIASGLCGLCVVIGLLGRSTAPPVGIASLLVYALSRLLIPFFPTDIAPPRTRTGTLHLLLAICTFSGIAIATGVLTETVVRLAPETTSVALLRGAALLTQGVAILFLVVYSLRRLHAIVGLVERGIYLGTLLWLGGSLWMLLH